MKNRLYDATKIDWDNLMFSTKELWMLLIPIMVEQMLNSLMGMADTMMVSNVGSVAMSAVSLVDSINTLVIQVVAALATGAAIICSHYLGKGDEKGANKAARQIFLTVIVISLTITAGGLIFCRPLLRLIFGAVEPAVMEDSIIYFLITASSYPFIALFNAGGAFYRAGGNSKFPMKISIISNVLNIIGNAVLIFGCNMGVAGAAISTLVSRAFCAIVVLYFLRKPKQKIVLNQYHTIRPDFPLIGKVLAIGIPAGVENGMFQFGKLAIQSTVSTLGTQAIAAQAMTVIFENVNGIAAIAVGIGLMTVAGQAFGAGRKEEAKYYIGTPYVWGGSTPETGFDCSGYVCWVYNQNGYDVGRTTANGLWNKSQHISEADAKPGDLVFFKGTYDTPGMSHTGIYLGNGMMVSAGDPIKYANIHSSYWEKHLAGFGRLSK